MRNIFWLLPSILLGACGDEELRSVTREPVARFEITQQLSAPPTGLNCVDNTGLGRSNFYEGLGTDAVVVGHQTTGADDRCRTKITARLNGFVAFDLSELAEAPPPTGTRVITSALMSASIRQAPGFDGGGIGCRTSTVGMLDNVYWTGGRDFFPDTRPDLANPPQLTRIGTLHIEDRPVGLDGWFAPVHPPVEVLAQSRGAVTFALDDRALAALQRSVDTNSPSLSRFGLYFIGTNGGSTGTNQTCLDYFEDLQLVAFFRDEP